MMKLAKIFGIAIAAITYVMVAQAANASPIVFSSVPDITNFSASDRTGWCDPCGSSWRVWDQFTLGSATNISGADLGISNFGEWPANVNVSVFNLGGGPGNTGALLFSQTVNQGNWTLGNVDGSQAVVHTDSISGLSLSAGTYVISFYGAGQSLYVPMFFQAGHMVQYDAQCNCYGGGNGGTLGFQLYGEASNVPAPAALALLGLGLGLVGLGGVRRMVKPA